MSVTININKLSLVHRGSGGMSTATLPDVCKTPTPGGPVPVPYPNISMATTLTGGTMSVSVDGGQMAAIEGSKFATSTGDEPGTVGGVFSNVFKMESTWLTYSFDVKMEGKGCCRLTDKKWHNKKNTVNMMGMANSPVPPASPSFEQKKQKLDDQRQEEFRPNAAVGDGSSAAALQEEARTGQQISPGTWHYEKCVGLANFYQKRQKEAAKEHQQGEMTADEYAELRETTTEGWARNVEAIEAADQVSNPPWPTNQSLK